MLMCFAECDEPYFLDIWATSSTDGSRGITSDVSGVAPTSISGKIWPRAVNGGVLLKTFEMVMIYLFPRLRARGSDSCHLDVTVKTLGSQKEPWTQGAPIQRVHI